MKIVAALLAVALAFLAGFAGLELATQAPGEVAWRVVDEGGGTRASADEVSDLRRVVSQLRRSVPEGIAAIELPEEATLLEQGVPLHRPAVREAVAYELVLTVGRPLMPMLWTRRAPEVLPMIEARLKEEGLPEDLKYLAMIESDLRWSVRSPAGAEGLWQFMPDTARRYGLEVNRALDERRDPEKATEAAIRYLRELHEMLGDWYLVAAAYNAGENRVKDALEEQGRRSYFDLFLPRETRRYVPRLLAAKLVFEDPQRFGLARMQPSFVPAYRHVQVEVRGLRADLLDLAREHGLDYAELRIANPQLRRSYLPRGVHVLRVPVEGAVQNPKDAPTP
jgi:hypothetical protein